MTNTVEIQVNAKDNTSAAFKAAENAGVSASKTITTAFSKAGGLVGGELGGVLGSLSTGFDDLGEHAVSMGTKMLVGGAGLASLGLLLGQIGSTEQAASQQLDTAIQQTGASVSDYSKQIDEAVNKGEDFGHSEADVKNALAQLTEATGDTSTALSYMTLVENLAAAKHESLAAAAQTVTMVLGGNTRVLKQYGIDLGSGTHTVQQLTDALNEMSIKLAGQASAASDTFMGHIDSVEQHVQAFVGTVSHDVAPGLTALGSVLAIVGAGMDIQAARATKAAASQTALAAANLKEAATADAATGSNVGLAASEDAVAASGDKAATSQLGSKLASAGAATGILAIAAAADIGGHALSDYIERNNSFVSVMKNATTVIDDVTAAVEQDNGVFGKQAQSVLASSLQADGLATKANKAGISLAQLTTGVSGNDAQFQQLIKTWQASGKPSSDTLVSLQLIRSEVDKGTISGAALTSALSQLSGTTDTVDNSMDAATAQADALANAFFDAADAAATVSGDLAQYAGQAISASNANIAAALGQDNLNTSFANFNQTLNGGSGTTKSVAAAVNEVQDYSTAIDELSGNNVSAAQQQDKFALSLLGMKDALASATPLNEQTSAVQGNTVGAIDNKEAVLDQIDAINQIADAQLKAGVATQTVTATMADNEKQLESSAAAAGLNAADVDALIKQFAVDPGQLPVKVRSDEAATAALAAKQATDSLSGSVAAQTPKVTANRDAFLQQLQAINQEAQQMLDAGDPIDMVNKKLGLNETALENAGIKAGMTKDQVHALVDEYGTLAAAVNQSVQTGVLKALSMMTDPVSEENFLAGLAVSNPALFKQLSASETHSGSGGYEHGGITGQAAGGGPRGNKVLVGEHGPEVVDLAPGSYVHPNTAMPMSGGSSGGQLSTSIDFTGATDGAFAQAFMALCRGGQIRFRQQWVTT